MMNQNIELNYDCWAIVCEKLSYTTLKSLTIRSDIPNICEEAVNDTIANREFNMTRDIKLMKTELNRWCGGDAVIVSAYDEGEYIYSGDYYYGEVEHVAAGFHKLGWDIYLEGNGGFIRDLEVWSSSDSDTDE
jgi:hypothetical protein